jgi:integrase/recombinase XerD
MERFEEFLQERRYLMGVSPKTIAYYRWAFNSYKQLAGDDPKQWVIKLRDKGVSAISVNTYICAMNTYWKWSGEYNEITKEGKHLAYLKEEQKILATLTSEQINHLLTWKSTNGTNIRRAHLMALTILDTGLRASEVLGLTKENVDFEVLTLKVLGKGGKHRLVPFSPELRKALWRYSQWVDGRILFGTRNNRKVSVRNFERDLDRLGKKVGITGVRFSPHTLRHSFACEYLKRGGNLFYLSRILGHSSIKTTELYLKSLGIEDLGAVHNGLSPLSAKR